MRLRERPTLRCRYGELKSVSWPTRGVKRGGFSIVELLISVLLGLLVIAGVLSLFGNTIRSNRDVLASARLNQELSAAMNVMVDELRRAGYSN